MKLNEAYLIVNEFLGLNTLGSVAGGVGNVAVKAVTNPIRTPVNAVMGAVKSVDNTFQNNNGNPLKTMAKVATTPVRAVGGAVGGGVKSLVNTIDPRDHDIINR